MIFRLSILFVVLFTMLSVHCANLISEDTAQPNPTAGTVFFKKQVLPILKKRCFECHSHESGEINGGLALDSRSGWELGGDSGPAVVPGETKQSLIIETIRYGNVDLQMPPDGKLSESEIILLEKWVAMGAPDPRRTDPVISKKGIDIETGRKHWAFQPVRVPKVPDVAETNWPLDEIDSFLLAKLELDQLHPADDTSRYTWLRRISLDLTGLPPTPQEIEAFIADSSDDAYARVADRLLDSRAYGERWARHWLDLTGYADQIGTANKVYAEYGWRYRDYLIDAFNSDKPFNQFIREQIAGDLLPGTVEERAAAITATGFLLLDNIEVGESDKMKLVVDVVDQQLIKVGTAFLGMTLGCARCHDHKFDPISQNEYYALAGIFKSTDSTHKVKYGVWSGIRSAQLPETTAQQTERDLKTQKHKKQLTTWIQTRDAIRKKVDALEKDSDERKKLEAQIPNLNRNIQHAEFFVPTAPRAYAVGDVEKPSDMRITIRGNPHALGAVVPRGFLKVISYSPPNKIPANQSGRLELANWIASPQNPLTARVTVNRIWQKLFGEGLVRSSDYFGLRGESPSHPDLLDFLAHRFVQNGWSQRKLIRSLVLSRAYRMGGTYNPQAAAKDPENRLLWRIAPQRLDAESLRDSLLLVAGTLQPSNGGPALALEYPENVSGLGPNNVNPPSFHLNKYYPGQKFQRTIYLPILRSGAQPAPAELRNLFDFTQPAEIAGQRPITTVPTQALFLMNSSEIKKRAAELAARTATLDDKPIEPSKRIEKLWLLTYSRPINKEEKAETLNFLNSQTDPQSAWIELCHVLFASNEFLMRL